MIIAMLKILYYTNATDDVEELLPKCAADCGGAWSVRGGGRRHEKGNVYEQ